MARKGHFKFTPGGAKGNDDRRYKLPREGPAKKKPTGGGGTPARPSVSRQKGRRTAGAISPKKDELRWNINRVERVIQLLGARYQEEIRTGTPVPNLELAKNHLAMLKREVKELQQAEEEARVLRKVEKTMQAKWKAEDKAADNKMRAVLAEYKVGPAEKLYLEAVKSGNRINMQRFGSNLSKQFGNVIKGVKRDQRFGIPAERKALVAALQAKLDQLINGR